MDPNTLQSADLIRHDKPTVGRRDIEKIAADLRTLAMAIVPPSGATEWGTIPTSPAITTQTDLVAYVAAQIAASGAGTAITKTVAQATSDAAGSLLKPGAMYHISDAYQALGGTAIPVFITAISTTKLNAYGVAQYVNATMGGSIYMKCGYDLNQTYTAYNDYIFYLYEGFWDNEVYQTNGTDTLAKMPFDAYGTASGGYAYFRGNRLRDVIGTWAAAKTGMVYCRAENCTINTSNVGGDSVGACFFDNADIRYGATVTLEANQGVFTLWANGPWSVAAYSKGYIGVGATVTINRAAVGNYIDDGQTLSTAGISPGYTQLNGMLTAFESTFGIDATFDATINPDASAVMHISNCPWAGVIGITDHSASSATVQEIQAGTPGRNYMIYVDNAAGSACTFDNSTGMLMMTAATHVLPNGNGSTITFNFSGARMNQRAVNILV